MALDDSGFAQVLHTVSQIIEQYPERYSNKNTFTVRGSKLSTEKLTKLKRAFETTLRTDCSSLDAQLKRLIANPSDVESKEKMKGITHTFRGSAKSFGYHLAGTVAAEANNIFKTTETLSVNDIQDLKNHVAALSLIAEKKITGDGGEAGLLLLQGLSIQIK